MLLIGSIVSGLDVVLGLVCIFSCRNTSDTGCSLFSALLLALAFLFLGDALLLGLTCLLLSLACLLLVLLLLGFGLLLVYRLVSTMALYSSAGILTLDSLLLVLLLLLLSLLLALNALLLFLLLPELFITSAPLLGVVGDLIQSWLQPGSSNRVDLGLLHELASSNVGLARVLRLELPLLLSTLASLGLPLFLQSRWNLASLGVDPLVHGVHVRSDPFLGSCQKLCAVVLLLLLVHLSHAGAELRHLLADATRLLLIIAVIIPTSAIAGGSSPLTAASHTTH